MYKFLIILVYFERPHIVLNALESINNIKYDNFELVIIDDGSKTPIMPIAKEVLSKEVLNKTAFLNVTDTLEYKLSIGGSRHGNFMNKCIEIADSNDLVMIVCDDDAIVDDALVNLNNWFEQYPNKQYTYGHVIAFNPEIEKAGRHIVKTQVPVNRTEDINPVCMVDSSQVVFRAATFHQGAKFPDVGTGALDAGLFTKLYELYGPCSYCGIDVQYKGVFRNQMGQRINMYETGDV